MASVYDRADIYDLIEDENRYNIYKEHWKNILKNRNIDTFLDVSIGSGSVTLPLADLGVCVRGSDLSKSMLENCRKKADARNIDVELRRCDFRTVANQFETKFACVASTGNSLPYVSNEDVIKTLEQMDSLVKPGGYLYFDIRNWDKILRDRDRFYLYNPFFDGDTRVNFMQVWDYNEDGTMTFNLLYTFEKENRLFQKEHFTEHYIPISKGILLDKLQKMNYKNIEVMNFPSSIQSTDINETDWYCVIAEKL